MNLLFEQFVTRLLEQTFQGTTVQVVAQRRDRSLLINDRTGRPYASVIPDVILERPDAAGRQRVPVDAKYKLYDEHRLDAGDVYQTFFYGYAYARTHEHAQGKAVAYLIYPATLGAEPVQLRVQRTDGVTSARIRTIALDVPAVLTAIREGQPMPAVALQGLRTSFPTAAAPAAAGSLAPT
jgi:5-methylcytosine-specific restriction enzyme subunit McrC